MDSDSLQEAKELASKTAKVASLLASGKIISISIQAFMFIVIARLLGPTNYGIYTLILGVAILISAFGNVSIGTYFNERIPYLISKKRSSEIGVALGDGTVAMVLPGIVLLIIGVFLSGLISNYVLHSYTYIPIVILSMFSILFFFLFSQFNLILVSYGDGKNSAIGNMIYSAVQSFMSIFLILLGYGIAGAILGYVLALLVGAVFQMVAAARRFGIKISANGLWTRIRSMLKFSMPLTGSNIINTLITNFAVVLLGLLFIPQFFIGEYGVAIKIGTLIDVVAGSIGIVLIPMFAEAVNNARMKKNLSKFFHYSVYFGLLFTTPMIAYVVVFSKYLIITLFAGAYSNSIFYMQLVSVGLLLSTFGIFATQLVISTRKTRTVLKYSLIVGIIEFISLLILTPLLHVVGVIIAILYIGSIATGILFINYLKRIGIKIEMGQIWRLFLANIILGLALSILLFVALSWAFLLVLGVVILLLVYPILIVKLRAISNDEVKLLREIGKEIPFIGTILDRLLAYALYFL